MSTKHIVNVIPPSVKRTGSYFVVEYSAGFLWKCRETKTVPSQYLEAFNDALSPLGYAISLSAERIVKILILITKTCQFHKKVMKLNTKNDKNPQMPLGSLLTSWKAKWNKPRRQSSQVMRTR